jgi:hypothetical protein
MGSFWVDEIQSSIPPSLLQLVKMIEHGSDIKSQLENDRCKSDLTISQLLLFNYHSKFSKKDSATAKLSWVWGFICCYLGLLINMPAAHRNSCPVWFMSFIKLNSSNFYTAWESSSLSPNMLTSYLMLTLNLENNWNHKQERNNEQGSGGRFLVEAWHRSHGTIFCE